MKLWLLPLCLLSCLAEPPAFPGAEGFGAETIGGRGGRILTVTNLNDSGPGSFRAAVETPGPRIVLFRVTGIIDLKSQLKLREPYITIAGQSAPGYGICLRGAEFSIETHDVIVRFLRSRPGDILGKEMDAINIVGNSHDVILDHCSASWSVDESLSPSGGLSNITVQWCLIGESLNKSVHSKGPHGYGSLVRAVGGVSLHHNLWVKNTARNPRLGDNYGKPPFPTFDVRNNVMYGWGGTCSGMTGDDLSANYVANYLKPGAESSQQAPIVLTKTAHVKYYLDGNIVENRPLTKEAMFTPTEVDGRKLFELVEKPFAAPRITQTTARQAYNDVLSWVGAYLPKRDSVDERILAEVRAGRGHLINSQTEVGGWPAFPPAVLQPDKDANGIPDAWEKAHRERPTYGYTRIEQYLNSLARR